MNIDHIKLYVSGAAVFLALLHLIWPSLGIDVTTIILMVVAVIPWLAPIVKSLELPGGWKIELQDFQNASARADGAGLLSTDSDSDSEATYLFETLANQDPNLALAGLRIEIEKRLVLLAKSQGIGTKMQGIGRLLNELAKHGVIDQIERAVLADMVGLLNQAVHGVAVDKRSAQWAIDIGPRLLAGLDERSK